MNDIYETDDFYEPSEFDAAIDDFKNILRKSVKSEIQAELKELREENNRLRNIKNRMNEIEREHIITMQNAKKEVMKMRFADILEACSPVFYKPFWYTIERPKCSKCDDSRKIVYTTPMGREAREPCKCKARKNRYKPTTLYVSEIRENIFSDAFIVWHEPYDERDGYVSKKVIKEDEICDDKDFSEIESEYNAYFRREERCAAYCEYLNKLEIEKEEMEDGQCRD